MSIGPDFIMVSEGTEGADDVGAVVPGQDNDPGSRDPSSTTVAGAVTNAMQQQAEIASDLVTQGGHVGDPIPLPSAD